MWNPSSRRCGSRRGVPATGATRTLAVGTALAVLASAAGAQTPKHHLKIATVAPEGSTWMRVMREIDAEVRKETGNEVGFKIYPGGVQGDEMVVLRKIRSGQLHGGGLTGQGLGQIAPAVRVLELPFLIEDYAQLDRVRDKLGARFESILHDAGYTVLGWADVGFVYLFSRQPIATQGDLKQAKMWLWEGDPLAEAFFKAAGVVPVPLPVTDVLTSLQTRLVDAVYSSPLACVATQWFTRVQHYTDVPVTFATGAVVVSNTAFETVPAAHRDTVRRICTTRFRALQLEARKQDAAALVEIQKSGVKRVAVTAAEKQRFEAIGRGVWAELAGRLYPQELLDAVQAAIAAPAPH
jgi:TRAP-type C4-dicarboxylate transport system substrate-binding protein